MKPLAQKKPAKDQREQLVLLGLVDLYLQTGKPVGSNTLKENGFEALSSATIRNYFAKLEEAGYLLQQHSSGGRIPTTLAYKLYADFHLHNLSPSDKSQDSVRSLLSKETREVASYLQQAAETLSDLTSSAIFLSAPRFDQDFILDVKFLAIDHKRLLCVLLTNFGKVHTEILYTEKKLHTFTIKKIEAYFIWRLTGLDKPQMDSEEEALASNYYKEIMLRHIVNYTHFSKEDLYKTGFSKLLHYPDFNDATALASGLSLFENTSQLHALLQEAAKAPSIRCFIGEDLQRFAPEASHCSVIAVPYRIHQTTVGSLALLGPNRLPYRKLFAVLQTASLAISETLTRSLYKFKIAFRQPQPSHLECKNTSSALADQTHYLLLENQSNEDCFT
jgi:heat-inducible transcriptional repressor